MPRFTENELVDRWEECYELCDHDPDKTDDLFARWHACNDLYHFGTDVQGMDKGKDPVTGRSRIDPNFHGWLCNELEAEESNMILVPRDHLKTSWVMLRIMQEVLKDPNHVRTALFSLNKRLVVSALNDIRNRLAKPIMRKLWPDEIPDPGRNFNGWKTSNQNQLTMRRFVEDGDPPKENQIEAWGQGTRITGNHYRLIVLDDIIDQDNCTTAEQLAKVEEWVGYLTHILDPTGKFIVIGTRYHYDDVYARILEGVFSRTAVRCATEPGGLDDVGSRPIYSYYTKDMLKKKRRDLYILTGSNYQFSCNPAEAPIWMADGTFRRIEHVRAGDEVIGFTLPIDGRQRRLAPARVVDTHVREAEVVKLTLESGRQVRCTAEHRWYTGRWAGDKTHATYMPAKVGRGLIDFVTSSGKPDRVVSIEPDGREPVYALHTTTGNYVAWGYASKNCQWYNQPIPDDSQMFPPPQRTYQTLSVSENATFWITIDPASTTADYSDRTAIVIACVAANGVIYIVEAHSLKEGHDTIAEKLCGWIDRYKPERVGIESGFHEDFQWIFKLKAGDFERQHQRQLSVSEFLPMKVGRQLTKAERVNRTLGAFCRSHRVFIHESLTELKRQMDKFPKVKQDDLVDAAAMIIPLSGAQLVGGGWDLPQPEVQTWYWTMQGRLDRRHQKDQSWAGRFKHAG